ncbi:MAG: CBS and ACT domain-containing protein [Desulfomonilaceae bacterium]|nr:CBS and ACT domain-containing protein [Desulfomonilaceae bacterium]
MLIQDWMHKHVITVDVNDTVDRALDLFREHNTSMLPVTGAGKLLGILTPRDLKRIVTTGDPQPDLSCVPDDVRKLKVSEVMSKNPLAVPPDYTVEETAEILLARKIPGCPVLDEHGNIVGIVTKKDLLEAFVVGSSIGKLGILCGFLVKDEPDTISDLFQVMRRYDARACSIMSCYANAPEGYRYLQIRAFHIDRRRLPQMKKELETKAKVLFIVDRRENTREVYEGSEHLIPDHLER